MPMRADTYPTLSGAFHNLICGERQSATDSGHVDQTQRLFVTFFARCSENVALSWMFLRSGRPGSNGSDQLGSSAPTIM